MGDIGAVATLLTKVFGFVVDPTGLSKMKREHLLQEIMRGIDEAIAKRDMAAADELFAHYRELRRQTS